MDSLTQVALGASLSVAVLGRRTALWRAALWGGMAGLLPDLDVLIDHGDDLQNMVHHRGLSHSLLLLTLLAPALAAVAGWTERRRGNLPDRPQASGSRWTLALWLALFTHPLLDLMTIYGTQVLQPFTDQAYGLGSIFIIDPLYSVPLLGGLIAAALQRSPDRGLRANRWGLALSTGYLAWTVLAQAVVVDRVRESLSAQGLSDRPVLVTPAPLQTLLWRVVVIDGPRYHEGYYALTDGSRPLRLQARDRGGELLQTMALQPQVAQLARFSDGFYSLALREGRLMVTDLRMGQHPYYVFSFDLGPNGVPGAKLQPAIQQGGRIPVGEGLVWLRKRIGGSDLPPPGG
jgi:inner membrane protein